MVLVLAGLSAVLAIFVTTALATPPSPTGLTVVTARGEFAEPLNVNTKFDNGGKVRIKTAGPVEMIAQRIEVAPGTTFGWHSHPGENANIIAQGTLTLYHDEHCTDGIAYGAGSAFPTHPDEVHLAKNNGTETVIIFSTYFAPKTTPPTAVRLDQASPGDGCPQ
jgi:quercetin dioxygenase-like cupin family protein